MSCRLLHTRIKKTAILISSCFLFLFNLPPKTASPTTSPSDSTATSVEISQRTFLSEPEIVPEQTSIFLLFHPTRQNAPNSEPLILSTVEHRHHPAWSSWQCLMISSGLSLQLRYSVIINDQLHDLRATV